MNGATDKYVTRWRALNGFPLIIRPIKPDDEHLLVDFHQALSDQSVHQRYFGQLRLSERVNHGRLSQLCLNDYGREFAIVAEHCPPSQLDPEIVGVARLCRFPDTKNAEFAVTVVDAWQGNGIGTQLLKQLVNMARKEGVQHIVGFILAGNHTMEYVAKRADFTIQQSSDGGLRAVLDL